MAVLTLLTLLSLIPSSLSYVGSLGGGLLVAVCSSVLTTGIIRLISQSLTSLMVGFSYNGVIGVVSLEFILISLSLLTGRMV